MKQEREQFLADLVRRLPNHSIPYIVRMAGKLIRLAKTHGRLAEDACNGCPEQETNLPIAAVNAAQKKWEERVEKGTARAEKAMTAIADSIGMCIHFSGDPRGYTCKLIIDGQEIPIPGL